MSHVLDSRHDQDLAFSRFVAFGTYFSSAYRASSLHQLLTLSAFLVEKMFGVTRQAENLTGFVLRLRTNYTVTLRNRSRVISDLHWLRVGREVVVLVFEAADALT